MYFLGFFAVSLSAAWSDLGVNLLIRFPLVNNFPHSTMMDLKLFANGLIIIPRLMDSNIC